MSCRLLTRLFSQRLRSVFSSSGSLVELPCFVSSNAIGTQQLVHKFSTSLCLSRSKFRHSREHIPVLFELWKRREEVGPEKPKHRSEFPNWNYEAELFGFCKRVNEEWRRETLIEAFTEKAYAEAEEQRRTKLSSLPAKSEQTEPSKDVNLQADTPSRLVTCNDQLASQGEALCRSYITAFLRHSLPAYPDEGVSSVCDFLISDDVLGYVCRNLGTADLILSTEFPPTVKVFANVLKALIGGLERDQNTQRARLFVHDFVVTQLSGRDINQFWNITNPMGLLAQTMKKSVEQGGAGCAGEPEARIIWKTGANTPLAAFKVAIYDSKSKAFLGQGGGETVMIAEQMAALDALYRLFGTSDWRMPFAFGQDARKGGLPEVVDQQQNN